SYRFSLQAKDGIQDRNVTRVQTFALPISSGRTDRPVARRRATGRSVRPEARRDQRQRRRSPPPPQEDTRSTWSPFRAGPPPPPRDRKSVVSGHSLALLRQRSNMPKKKINR